MIRDNSSSPTHPSPILIMGEGEGGGGAFLVKRISLFERDSRDVSALSLPVALFPPISPVSLESGIGDGSRSAHE